MRNVFHVNWKSISKKLFQSLRWIYWSCTWGIWIFVKFNSLALNEGVLSAKLKGLIAVAVAHTSGCPYCLELHVSQAKNNNASKEETVEAVMVATALNAYDQVAQLT